MAWFLNHYKCDRCRRRWANEWSCMCDDRCAHCGSSEITPYKSERLTTIVEKEETQFVVFRSPENAEHDPEYQELGRFQTEQEAIAFVEDN